VAFTLVFLWSDILVLALLLGGACWLWSALRREYWRVALRQVAANRVAMLSFGVLCLYTVIGLLDTIHYRSTEGRIVSVLDILGKPLAERTETTYSAPFATHSFSRVNVSRGGVQVSEYPRLECAATGLADPEQEAAPDIRRRALAGLGWGLGSAVLLFGLVALGAHWSERLRRRQTALYWGAGFLGVVCLLLAEALTLSADGGYHILGTDKTGQDVFLAALKSVRTGLIIGTLTTLIVTPFAILFGVLAGYFGGKIDDLIQYVYTTLSSIPDILLIAAVMLILQSWLARLPAAEQDTVIAADYRLVALCIIMGITSWTGLCRLIRAEVLKLRELEYVQAADAFGVSRARVMARHLVPNLMHIVLISVVLRFSGLVLAEAVLAYIGIGVDPAMQSWGNMINQSRLELARDPVVWWNLLAAFLFMVGLVLPANLFGDAVRDALDPRLRV